MPTDALERRSVLQTLARGVELDRQVGQADHGLGQALEAQAREPAGVAADVEQARRRRGGETLANGGERLVGVVVVEREPAAARGLGQHRRGRELFVRGAVSESSIRTKTT